jgi:hypothetical protein
MAAPASTPTPRFDRLPALTWLALAGILGLGIALRLRWPLEPLSDPDTWGYLHPALSELIGHGFKHTYGRNFIYPGWVYLWLRGCGDFRAICLAQHLLGLATGLLLWRVWQRWREWFAQPRLPDWIATLVGLGLVAFYVSSTTVIFLEQRIRPEAIFPFFAILAIYLTMEFLRAWFVTRRTLWAAVYGGGVVFDAILCYELKPSFGFALGVALLPLLAAVLQPRQTWRRRLAIAGAAAAALVLAGLLLLWPEHKLARADNISALFLPETLLTVHADVIHEQMTRDLAAGNPTPYPTAWLAALNDRLGHELALASSPEQKPYPSLGFNPDYLMYQDSLCRFLYREIGVRRIIRLCFYYYERAWRYQPGAMARNVGRQLGIFYGQNCPAFWLGRAIDISRNYRKTIAAFEPANYQKEMLAYAPARDYLAASGRLADTDAVYRQGPIFTLANTVAAEVYLPLLIAVSTSWLLVLCLPIAGLRQELGPAGALVLLFFAYTFGNCLTVAIVHSLNIDRYSSNLVIFTILAEAGALFWFTEVLLCARFRLNPELYEPSSRSPADAARQ